MNRKPALTLLAACLGLGGCAAPGTAPADQGSTAGAPPPATKGFVRLSAPETTPAGRGFEVVIDSAGHDGETASLYAFASDYDRPADCTDTEVTARPVTLLGGPQSVPVTGWGRHNDLDGKDIHFVLSSTAGTTGCGDITTRALVSITPKIYSATYDSNAFKPRAGKEFRYSANGGIYNATFVAQITYHVTWVGPFVSAPEAQASPCRTEPVAFVDDAEVRATDNAQWTRSVAKPGVYRLLVAVEATPYTEAFESDCSTATLITVQL